MGGRVGVLLLELVKSCGQFLGVSLKARGAVPALFLAGLDEAVEGRCQAAAYPPDGLFEGAAHGVDHLCVGIKRLHVMGRQSVEVELLAQNLKKLSCDQRENMAPATCSKGICGWVVIRGTWRPLARRRRIWRAVSPLRSRIGFSARSTVVVLVPAGPWSGTSRVRTPPVASPSPCSSCAK